MRMFECHMNNDYFRLCASWLGIVFYYEDAVND
jgi:hypothetical protein